MFPFLSAVMGMGSAIPSFLTSAIPGIGGAASGAAGAAGTAAVPTAASGSMPFGLDMGKLLPQKGGQGQQSPIPQAPTPEIAAAAKPNVNVQGLLDILNGKSRLGI